MSERRRHPGDARQPAATFPVLDGFAAAWDTRVERTVHGHQVPFIGRATLIANKKAAGRLRDLADVEALGESE